MYVYICHSNNFIETLNRNSLIIEMKGKEDTVICFNIISNCYIRCIRPSGHFTNTWMWYVDYIP